MRFFLFFIIFFFHFNSSEIPFPITNCFETKDCGIESIGSFHIPYFDVDSDQNATLEGYLFSITNGLPYELNLYWDIIGTFNHHHIDSKTLITIKPSNFKYLDTRVYETQTLRLFVEVPVEYETNSDQNDTVFESIDRSVGYIDKKIGKKTKVCDYLFRACYETRSADTEICNEYSSACNNFGIKTEEEELLESYIIKYWSHLITRKDKENFEIDRLTLVKYLIDHDQSQITSSISSSSKSKKDWNYYINTNRFSKEDVDIIRKKDQDDLSAAQTTTAVLAIVLGLVLIAALLIIFYKYDCRNEIVTVWNRNTSSNIETEKHKHEHKKPKESYI